ncbi:Zinc finger, CCHC-type domain-containing protein [Strongyloides ratti]|uniref:Zinc finger, CCHC-type domain-containing protein n=1 Tax=Strongyloides ratti TaxID=34506 RepID=A0A090KV93_STRRB|nr:Zinc finger, CCHC-type domain-containing protein [Strongyloides ratti]CEF61336.1 Zinc finger, CCHC-type domain-containing protein [Strongyloides ratti]
MPNFSSTVQRQEIKKIVEDVLEGLETTVEYEDLGKEFLEELVQFANLSDRRRIVTVKKKLGLRTTIRKENLNIEKGSFKKKRKNLRKKNNVNHNRLEGHFEKQQNDRTRIKKPLVCFDCGENGHMRFECPKKGKTEPFIQSKVCEIKKAKTGPKLEYVEPMNLDKRLKLIFLNKSEMKDLGEDVTLPTLIKYMNDS